MHLQFISSNWINFFCHLMSCVLFIFIIRCLLYCLLALKKNNWFVSIQTCLSNQSQQLKCLWNKTALSFFQSWPFFHSQTWLVIVEKCTITFMNSFVTLVFDPYFSLPSLTWIMFNWIDVDAFCLVCNSKIQKKKTKARAKKSFI